MARSRKVRVALDAMGGDFAPEATVEGAVLAARRGGVEVILTGSVSVLERELDKYDNSRALPIRCVEAKEVIREGEPPSLAIRGRPDASIAVAARLVKSGEADAMVGAGNSGATGVSAIYYIGMLEGMERPAIGGSFGSFAPGVMMVDLGANVDCKPHHLLAFAVAGCVFAEKFHNISNPTVGLLSTGAERGKGSEVVKDTYQLLENSGLNFIGNIEGDDVLSGRANVVVCDGFIGNVILKFYEGIGKHAKVYLEQKLRRCPPLRSMVGTFFDKIFPVKRISYEGEEAGGGILWGVDGVARVAHGCCKAPQIAHAIMGAREAFEADIVGALRSRLLQLKSEGVL
ncbi:MAG: phosphate acyltransferase PlsX [Dehalococcoidia bacterium]|nr:phosphate acyltransferase PlsX [Dehalococcoidia bacterium]